MPNSRLRTSDGIRIALCAAETDAEPGDCYLDDAAHYALAAKFASDWRGQTVLWEYPVEWSEMGRHKLRDAEQELTEWLAQQAHPKEPR